MNTIQNFENIKNNTELSLNLNLIISADNKHAVTDYKVYDWLQNILDNPKKDVYCATSAQFNAIRLAVKAGLIQPFSFMFNNNKVQILSTGKLDHHPKGLFDVSLQQLALLTRK
tara:strand:- start:177 stop:518 length:342 start_codon:yes stop_codon:yes gene_type:complete